MKFYGDFAAAYGTCWIVVMVLALATMSHIDTGMFGLLGFPAIGVSYAVIRLGQRRSGPRRTSEVDWLRRRVEKLERELREGAGGPEPDARS